MLKQNTRKGSGNIRTILIDGDILAYQTTAALETPIDWGHDIWSLHCDFGQCKSKLDEQVEEYRQELAADAVIIALSPQKNFRYRIYPQYKSNRTGKRKPMCYAALRDYIKTAYQTFQRPDIEADDVLGILSTSEKIIKGEKIIVSLDKDMKTIPGLICDMRSYDIHQVTEAEADYRHIYQTLIGDTTDGYPGCPGVGSKTAEKLLAETDSTYATMWPIVVEQFAKKGLGEEVALTMARLARICRRDDYDFKRREVILWNPPTTQ